MVLADIGDLTGPDWRPVLSLAFIVPLFLLTAWLFFRHRRSAYRSITLAALSASFWKVADNRLR